MTDTCLIQKVQRRAAHHLLKQPSEMSLAQVTARRELPYRTSMSVMLMNIFQSRPQRKAASDRCPRLIALPLRHAQQLQSQCHAIGTKKCVTVFFVRNAFLCNSINEPGQMTGFIGTQHMFPVQKHSQLNIIPISSVQASIRKKLIKVNENIGPQASGTRCRAGGVRQISRYESHISRMKRYSVLTKRQEATLFATQADLQTIVKMQPATESIGDAPLFP